MNVTNSITSINEAFWRPQHTVPTAIILELLAILGTYRAAMDLDRFLVVRTIYKTGIIVPNTHPGVQPIAL